MLGTFNSRGKRMLEDLFFSNSKKDDEDLDHPLMIAIIGFMISSIYFLPFISLGVVLIAGCCISTIALHVLRKENNYFMAAFILISASLLMNVISFVVFDQLPIVIHIITFILFIAIFIFLHFGIRKLCWEIQYYTYNKSFLLGTVIFLIGIASNLIDSNVVIIAYMAVAILFFYVITYFIKELLTDIKHRWTPKNSLEMPIRLWGFSLVTLFVLLVIKYGMQ